MLRAPRGLRARGRQTNVADSIPRRLFEQARQRPDAPAYLTKENGIWRAASWERYASEVRQATRALIALGFQPGSTVCILGFNRPEWVVLDVATMAAGGAPAGIYTTSSEEQVKYILSHSECPLVLVENDEQWQKVKAVRGEVSSLKHVVLMRDAGVSDPGAMKWEDFMSRGDVTPAAEVDARVEALEPSGLATLIYTSGTTGPPKAVMLSHENLSFTASMLREATDIQPGGRNLSYLPLSHIAEQMASIHGPITGGASVYFAESIEKLAENLKEVRPTLFFGVPRIWEKFHAAISSKMAQATGPKARLAAWARDVGARVSALRVQGREPSGLLAVQYGIAKRVVFSRIQEAIGIDQATTLVSGAAPISKEIIEFFASLDVVIQEIYGQSEDSGPTTFNLRGRTRFGSVGVPVPGVEVRIGDDGEILVKGKNVFAGYYKDPEATAEALSDGWLHSGDLGKFDGDGFLHITGRKKDIIITAGGKNITPKNIELAIKDDPIVDEVVVVGDRQRFLTALITLEPEATKKFCEAHGIGGAPHESPEIEAAIRARVDKVNLGLNGVEKIKKFKILHRSLSIADGELTPTLKVKRNVVVDHFAAEIAEMYGGGSA